VYRSYKTGNQRAFVVAINGTKAMC